MNSADTRPSLADLRSATRHQCITTEDHTERDACRFACVDRRDFTALLDIAEAADHAETMRNKHGYDFGLEPESSAAQDRLDIALSKVRP